MPQKDLPERTKMVLKALDFTPKILADELDITIHQARRVMYGKGIIFMSEFIGIVNLLRNIDCNLFFEGAKALNSNEKDKQNTKEGG